MNGFAIACVGLTLAMGAGDEDTPLSVLRTRELIIPIYTTIERRDKIDALRLRVSDDQGKTWKTAGEYAPATKSASYSAPRDGEYWFTLQVVLKDGKVEPASDSDARSLRVRVDTRPGAETEDDLDALEREAEELRRKADLLWKRVVELKARRQSK